MQSLKTGFNFVLKIFLSIFFKKIKRIKGKLNRIKFQIEIKFFNS